MGTWNLTGVTDPEINKGNIKLFFDNEKLKTIECQPPVLENDLKNIVDILNPIVKEQFSNKIYDILSEIGNEDIINLIMDNCDDIMDDCVNSNNYYDSFIQYGIEEGYYEGYGAYLEFNDYSSILQNGDVEEDIFISSPLDENPKLAKKVKDVLEKLKNEDNFKELIIDVNKYGTYLMLNLGKYLECDSYIGGWVTPNHNIILEDEYKKYNITPEKIKEFDSRKDLDTIIEERNEYIDKNFDTLNQKAIDNTIYSDDEIDDEDVDDDDKALNLIMM